MNKHPVINALLAAVYIGTLVTLVNAFAGGPDTPDKGGLLIPMVMLSLFTLSAAVMGYLFVSVPLMMYFDGKKKEAVSFFLTTVASFAAVTLVLVAILFSFSQGWLW
jgi:hypothetical protein